MTNKNNHDQTVKFDFDLSEEVSEAGYILKRVYHALEERGYNPVNQIVGYLISGDPAYITSYKDARTMIRTVDRDDILEELISSYINKNS
ncbi:MAG: IreB family regulatory phosphoprotein [Bacillota bacterium]